MSEVQAMLRHYAEVRNRLRFPPNAVPDTGINLRRKKEQMPALALPEIPTSKEPLTEAQQSRVDTFRTSFCRKDVTFRNILRFVAAEFGIEYHLVISRTRTVPVVLPRQVAFYLSNKHLKQSLASMGRNMGLDHTSVLHGRDKIRRLVATNPEFRAQIEAIEVKLLENFPRLALPAEYECPVEIESGEGPQIQEVYGVGEAGGSTFRDAEAGAHQDVEWSVRDATTAIQAAPQEEQ